MVPVPTITAINPSFAVRLLLEGRMGFIIAGQFFPLTGLLSAMDEGFQRLYAALLGNIPYDLKDFNQRAKDFFDCWPSNVGGKHDKFFENFTFIWRRLLNSSNFKSAEEIWSLAVSAAQSWEADHPNASIHKGTPFYFWGMTAILNGELDRGYALMHQAVEEDVRMYGTQFPPSPAFALATLNSQKLDQAFRTWVLRKAALVDASIQKYCSISGTSFDLQSFQQKFLFQPPHRDTAFLFAYVLGRLIKLGEVPDYAKENDFTSQIQLNLLFDMTLVVDAAIAPHDIGHWGFIDYATFLSAQCKLGITKSDLSEANAAFRSDFGGTIEKLLANTFVLSSGNPITPLSRDLILSYGIRNFGAHHIKSITIIRQQFDIIMQAVFNSLFLTAENLY
jgi:hypothetical protein